MKVVLHVDERSLRRSSSQSETDEYETMKIVSKSQVKRMERKDKAGEPVFITGRGKPDGAELQRGEVGRADFV